MKPRHATALSLVVVWYLMMPPVKPCATQPGDPLSAYCLDGQDGVCFDPDAPLGEWTHDLDEFHSAAECAENLDMPIWQTMAPSPAICNGKHKTPFMCIRADDPRLAK
jgi:hypothetical protein